MSPITHLFVRSSIRKTRDPHHDKYEVLVDHMMTRQVQMGSPLEEASSIMCVHTGKLPYHKHLSVVVTNLLRLAFFPIPLMRTVHVFTCEWCGVEYSPMFHMAKWTVGQCGVFLFSIASSGPVLLGVFKNYIIRRKKLPDDMANFPFWALLFWNEVFNKGVMHEPKTTSYSCTRIYSILVAHLSLRTCWPWHLISLPLCD